MVVGQDLELISILASSEFRLLAGRAPVENP
jgi:hypothetical protein